MRRAYGSRLPELVDRAANDEGIAAIYAETVRAVGTWVPDLEIRQIDVAGPAPGPRRAQPRRDRPRQRARRHDRRRDGARVTAYSGVPLASLPAPDVIIPLEFEAALGAIRARMAALHPPAAEVIENEAEPLTKLLELAAYVAMAARAEANDQARGCLLAHARGPDLDGIAAALGTARQVVAPADPDAVPPTPAVLQDDDALRRTAQIAFERLSTAGPEGAYIAHALAADGRVKDAAVASPSPGDVTLTILATAGDGGPPLELLQTIDAAMQDRIPYTDRLTVAPARIAPYTIEGRDRGRAGARRPRRSSRPPAPAPRPTPPPSTRSAATSRAAPSSPRSTSPAPPGCACTGRTPT